jgi:hypothetical protein
MALDFTGAPAERAMVGLPGIHLRDLRERPHRRRGRGLRELMDWMGHSSTRAALIHQHSSGERQCALADAVGDAPRSAPQRSAR